MHTITPTPDMARLRAPLATFCEHGAQLGANACGPEP
jgi:hypothetical protein